MATLLKGTVITRSASNFSDMLFMVIEMASPRGFSYFILGAEKYAKNCPKMVIFVHSDFSSFLPITLVQNKNLEIASAMPFIFHRFTIQNFSRACRR